MELLIVSSNELFIKNIKETVAALGIVADSTVSMADAKERMQIKQLDVVIIDDEYHRDGAYSKVLSITEAVQTADGMGWDFYEPHNIVVVTKAQSAPSANLGAVIIDSTNSRIGALVPFLTSIE